MKLYVQWQPRLVLLLTGYLVRPIETRFSPCQGKALLEEQCDFDEDCGSFGTYCHPTGICQCHAHYEPVTHTDKSTGLQRVQCTKLPDQVDQQCFRKCAEPLFCREGRCQCVYSKEVNGTCVVDRKRGDRCSRHTDCNRPFMACVKNQCQCLVGTVGTAEGSCIALPNCPLGGAPSGLCTRYSDVQQHYDNLLNDKSNGSIVRLDSCPIGRYCMTFDTSTSGHCCPATCPLATAVDLQYSCVVGATNHCPSRTHFCHRVSGRNYAFAVCCKRPCQQDGPDSLYVKGACVARSYLDGPCSRQEQCDASSTMRCAPSGRCECKDPSYTAKIDPLTHAVWNPAQTCALTCERNNGRDTVCNRPVLLGHHCYVQEQCPTGSGCYRGRCVCRCGYVQVGSRCQLPTTVSTTTARPRLVGNNVVPNVGGNRFLNLLNSFLDKTGLQQFGGIG